MKINAWRGSTCWIWSISWSKDEERFLGGNFHLGHGKKDFWKGQKITPKAIGYLKDFQKRYFSKWKTLEPKWDEKPPRPTIKSWVVTKEIFWEGEFFRRKFKYPPQIQIKDFDKTRNKILGVTSSECCAPVEDVPESSTSKSKKSKAAVLETKKVSVKEDGTGGAFTISPTLDSK